MEFQPQPDDIAYLRTFKFEDLTYRGTIEYRSACCQPISDVMTVAAFHLGLQGKVKELKNLLDSDTSLYHHGKVLDLCREGLSERGRGEEKYLEPLYQRINNRTNPAKEMLRRLQNGESMETIIKDFAEV